jgi:hypothetical protein
MVFSAPPPEPRTEKGYIPTKPKLKHVIPEPPVDPSSKKPKKKGRQSFSSLGEQYGVPPMEIIYFNFPDLRNAPGKRVAEYVNWYLNHNLGCTETTEDGKNYLFSGGEVIWIPVNGESPGEVGDHANLDEIARSLRLEPSEFRKFVDTYLTWVDGVNTVIIGLLAEFGAISAGAGALSGLFGAALVPIGTLLAITRIEDRRHQRIALYAAAYQYTDWVMNPHALISSGPVSRPTLPKQFFQNIAGIVPPPSPSDLRYLQTLAGYWNGGADEMQGKLKQQVLLAHGKVLQESKLEDRSAWTQPKTEVVLKLAIRQQAALNKGNLASGQAVLDMVYKQLTTQQPVFGSRSTLPYPCSALGTGHDK